MKIFKCEAQDDVLYFEAVNLSEAKQRLHDDPMMGDIPEELLTWTEIDKLPEGEELF